ncbi:MAG: hypothetical protein AB1567_08905 [bacterium]
MREYPPGDSIIISYGIYCSSSLLPLVKNNNIYNIINYNFWTDTEDAQIAEYNWWGSDPPDTNKFSSNIDYTPWLTNYRGAKITIISPTYGSIGTIVTLKGDRFGSNELVKISFGTTLTITTVSSDIIGAFSTYFTIDTQPYGTTSITAIGLTSGASASEFFTILGNIILITPNSGSIGSIVTIKGNGYRTSEEVRISFGTTVSICSLSSSEAGTFSVIFTTDTQPYGTTSIIATGLTSGSKAYATFFVLPNISLLTPTEGTVGIKVTVCGNGYGVNDDIVIHFGTIIPIATSVASDAGTFSTIFTFPLQVRGTKTVTAKGMKTQVKEEAFFNVLSSTRLEIKPETKIVTKGDEFGLDVWLRDVVNLAGLDVSINFDPSLLEVLDDEPGTPNIQISQGEFPTNTLVLYNAASNIAGYIDYSVGLVPATNTATGSGILAKAKFKAIAPGTATIYFVFDEPNNRYTVLKDSNNQPIPVTTYGGTVTIYEYGSMEGYVVIAPSRDTGTNAGILVTLVGVGATNTVVDGYYTFLEVVPGTYTLQADTSGVAPGTITGIVIYPGTKTIVATLTLLNGDSNNDGVVDIGDFMVLRGIYKAIAGQLIGNEYCISSIIVKKAI